MTSLNKYIENHNQEIQQTQEQISQIQKQLRDLEQQLRVEQQLYQAKETAEVEVSDTFIHLKKLFIDICGVFPPSALDDLADEIADMAEEVKENYQEYAQSGRFLNGAEEEEIEESQELTDANDYHLIIESLPLEDDNEIILTQSQIETIIRHKDDKILTFLKQQLGISGRVKQMSTLSQKMAEQKLTRKRIEDIMTAAELISKPRVLNGSHAT